jgi:hypothetical protein
MLPLELLRRATQRVLTEAEKTHREQVFGKEEKLGELVYKFNTKDQADICIFVPQKQLPICRRRVRYRYMWMLVKHNTEKTFAGPRTPRSEDASPGLMEQYKP